MLKFTTPQQVAENTIIDQIILETASGDQTISVNKFKGAVVVDPNLGNYVVIDFTVTDTSAMNIGRIRLMHGQKPVAISEDTQLLIVKEAHKNLKIRLAAQFAGAENCKFNTTSVNLPYATPFREGVVRFNNGDEINKSGTVYSAADVDAKIDAVTESLGNLDQYAKKAEQNEFTAANTFTAGITVNGEIGGTAVTDAGTDGDKHIVNVGYADNKYLSKEIAAATYLTKNDAGTTYLTKTDASSTYLTQKNAASIYLTKTDANTAAANYAKLNANNEFATGTTNTFNGDVTVKGIFAVGESQNAATLAVSGDSVSGTAINNDKLGDASSNKLPTEGAVVQTINASIAAAKSTLETKDNDLQSQIDGINAGQNLADIVNNTTELEGYNVSHLKAKGDSLPGKPSTPLTIGDKVQVLGGANVQSSVYELVKGTKQAEADIQSTNNTNYYWRYIGVYGTNAYTKAEIDTELAKKVDKTQITTTISGDTATNENIPSASAVKTYVDTVAGALPNKYVTLADEQEITGAKTFANGNITIANPNTDHKDKHYVTIGSNNTNDSGYKSSITHNDFTHNDFAEESFIRSGKSGNDNVSYTSSLLRHGTDRYTFGSKLEQHIGTHYNYTASDMYMTTGDPNEVSPLPAAQIGTPGNASITDPSLKENYVERIRLRKNTSTVDNIEGGFLSAGTSVTDIDLFADNINNVFSNEVSFRVCTTSGEGVKTDKSVLRIYPSGIWYRTQAGNTVGETEYQLRTAGSLDFETSITNDANDSHLPTSLAVKNYVATTVDAKITELQGGMSYLKLNSPDDIQTVNSSVVFNGIISGTAVAAGKQQSADGSKLVTVAYANEKFAQLAAENTFTGATNTFQAITATTVNAQAFHGEGVTPSQMNDGDITQNPGKIVSLAFAENRYVKQNAISDKSKIGAMGLFLYTGGDFKEMGTEVHGSLLHAVGMQLPMDGVVSWSQGAAVSTAEAETTWKLLNNTIAGEPCLVLAIRVG